MNFIEASDVLYPVLGKNISKIALGYMIPNEELIRSDKPNMSEFLIDHKIDLSKMDHIYSLIKQYYDKEIDCYKSYIENRDCNECGEYCGGRYDLRVEYLLLYNAKLPGWICLDDRNVRDALSMHISDDDILCKGLLEAFLKDLKLETNSCKKVIDTN